MHFLAMLRPCFCLDYPVCGCVSVLMIYLSVQQDSVAVVASVQCIAFQGCCCLYNQPQVPFTTCAQVKGFVCDSVVFVVFSSTAIPGIICANPGRMDKGCTGCFQFWVVKC